MPLSNRPRKRRPNCLAGSNAVYDRAKRAPVAQPEPIMAKSPQQTTSALPFEAVPELSRSGT
ncbi:hypothetical protein, partial [Stenotrophomonas maltophilia]|uniref:hypothetical protein n=1 Tax=Stenotrophomonas maltophilia TaxID=40324 RepID=UPI001952D1AA